MTEKDDFLERTREALGCLERALLALTRERPPAEHPVMFALMAEPIVDTIRDLRREIDDYIGLTFAVEQQSQPEIARVLDGTDFEAAELIPAEWPSHTADAPGVRVS
jgi:hypothetical protein